MAELTAEQMFELKALYEQTTQGEWQLQDSCSWRRIGTVEPYSDGGVMCPTNQRSDNHPDLLARREDLQFTVAAHNLFPALIETIEAKDVEVVTLHAQLTAEQEAKNNWWRCKTHGDQPQNAWGCPQCVVALRATLAERDERIKELEEKPK